MRIALCALACCCALVPSIAVADTVVPQGTRAMPTRLARPFLPMMRAASPNASFVTYTGKLVVNLTISIQSAIKSGDIIECTAEAEVEDASSGHSSFSDVTVAASRSGSTATCSVPVPYSWSLASASSDMVGLSYQITNVGSNNTEDLPQVVSEQSVSDFAVPKSGTTTTFAVKATI